MRAHQAWRTAAAAQMPRLRRVDRRWGRVAAPLAAQRAARAELPVARRPKAGPRKRAWRQAARVEVERLEGMARGLRQAVAAERRLARVGLLAVRRLRRDPPRAGPATPIAGAVRAVPCKADRSPATALRAFYFFCVPERYCAAVAMRRALTDGAYASAP